MGSAPRLYDEQYGYPYMTRSGRVAWVVRSGIDILRQLDELEYEWTTVI